MHDATSEQGQQTLEAGMTNGTREGLDAQLGNYLEVFLRTPNAVLVHDQDSRILALSDKAMKLFGLTREQAMRSTIADLTSSPSDEARLRDITTQVMAEGSMSFDWHARMHNRAETFLARVTLEAIRWSGRPAVLAMVQDVTEQRKVEAALVESERQYKMLFEHLVSGFALHEMLTDEAGRPVDYRFLDVNPAYSRMTGLTWDMCVGKRVRELLPDVEPYWIETFGRVALTGESIKYANYAAELGRHYEVTAFCPQKGQFAVLVSDVSEQVEQRALLQKTVTEVEEANADLEELNARLEDMVQERTADLQAANTSLAVRMQELEQAQEELIRSEKLASIGELVAGVAHEINTPLGVGVTAASFLSTSIEESIRANAGLSSDPVFSRLSAKWMDTSRIILSNLERAARLVKSFKQVSVDRTSDPLRRIRLREYLDEVLVSLNPMIRRSGSSVVNEVPDTIEWVTYPGAMSQIVTNLVTNALMHAFPEDRTGTMTLVAEQTEDRIRFVFRDDGVGMSAEVRRKVFQPFFTTRKESGGSGLGLFIVQNLVANRLQGSLECREAAGGGTEFEALFPLVLAESPQL